MADEAENGGSSTVNSQVIDSVSAANALAVGQGPASAASMLSLAATETAALGMYNAIARQQADATINSAAVAALCARIVGTSPPADATAAPGIASAAEAQAQASIRVLTALAAQTGDPEAAGAALGRLAAAASAHNPGS